MTIKYSINTLNLASFNRKQVISMHSLALPQQQSAKDICVIVELQDFQKFFFTQNKVRVNFKISITV